MALVLLKFHQKTHLSISIYLRYNDTILHAIQNMSDILLPGHWETIPLHVGQCVTYCFILKEIRYERLENEQKKNVVSFFRHQENCFFGIK